MARPPYPYIRREDYPDSEDYARALYESGGPIPDSFLRGRSGGHFGDLVRATWGGENFGDTALAESRDEQRRGRHRFVLRYRGGRPRRRR